jgi:para-nitrobenzyl esterase
MGKTLLPKSEDCLTLAVYTPSLEERLPVAVWIHGGGNCYGGGDLECYDGSALARAGHMVVVNLNFRLGALGFLCYPGLNEENLSIEDQLLALHWVQEHIEEFGGDPTRVTLFGQSAGGNSVVHILSRPDSEGLFGQIVLESPSLGRGNHTREDAFEVGRAVLENLGIDTESKSDIRSRTEKKSVEEILDATDKIPVELRRKYQGMVFKPVMDEWHTPQQTIQAAASEAIRRKIKILIGTTKDEMHAFMLQRDPASLKRAAEGQRVRYEKPAHDFAMAAAEGGCDVWKYRFDWKAPASPYDACHCIELPFVFGNLQAEAMPMLAGASREELERLRSALQPLWIRFFSFEEMDPQIWPRFTATDSRIKCFDNQNNPVIPEPDYKE